MSDRYSIKDLERVSGIKAHTLRIWEQRYDILSPERTNTNIRYYSNEDLKKVLNISLLNNNGYKISNIAKLSKESLLLEVEKFLNAYHNESDQIENLVLSLMDLNEKRFEETIQKSIIHFGFESTIENIVFPFFRQMGNMWQVGIINPAQEHYISNLVRQKLIVGIDGAEAAVNLNPKKILFFLPNNELHEMGLLYTHYLSKIKGHHCFYLGQSVPFEDLVTISNSIKADFIVSILTSPMSHKDLTDFLTQCDKQISHSNFLMSGRLMLAPEEKYPLPSSRFTVFNDFLDFKKHL